MTDLYATLDGMDADEFRQVQRRVEAMMSDYQDRRHREAVAAAEQVAKEHGFKLADLVGGGKPALRDTRGQPKLRPERPFSSKNFAECRRAAAQRRWP